MAVALAAAGCQANTGSNNNGDTGGQKQESAISYNPADSLGPAAAVDGAVKGGTVNVLLVDDMEHLDPARSYVNIQQVAMGLVYRTLTTFKEIPQADGTVKSTLVGDLAEIPGTDVSASKNCTSWDFKLKKGIKYEDGTEVKAADVAYGIARSFSPDLAEGPHYIQQWLTDSPQYNTTYKGPYNGGADLPPGVTLKDDLTINFAFAKPHCDMPYAASMPMTAAVPKAKDTKADYDLKPFSDGPYKIESRKPGVSLTLVRNDNWDPATDAVHNAYPDKLTWEIGVESDAINRRLIADSGTDQTSTTWTNVTSELVPQTQPAEVQKRIVQGGTQFVWYLNINTQRVTDLTVRKAINLAIDKEALLKPIGGQTAGTPTSELMSPTTAGFAKYDIFGVPNTGDAEKAKAMLAGKAPDLVLGHANTTRRTDQANAMKAALEKAGFKITLAPIEASAYYTKVGEKTNQYDIYLSGWGSDWPLGSTIIPPLFDGASITDTGNQDLAYLNDPAINSEIVRINGLPATDAAAAWAVLDKKIMTDDAPVVPLYTDRNYTLNGSKIGGGFLSPAFGVTSLNKIFVKP